MIVLPDQPTGADLAAALRATRPQAMTIREHLRPLTKNGRGWLRELEKARRPKSETVARVRAFLEGRPVPPSARVEAAAAAPPDPPGPLSPRDRLIAQCAAEARDREQRLRHAMVMGVTGGSSIDLTAPPGAKGESRTARAAPCFRCGTRADIGCRHQRPDHEGIAA